MLFTMSSRPSGAAAAGAATITWPTFRLVTCAGAGAGQVRVPSASEESADIAEAVSTTVAEVVAVWGDTGWPAEAVWPFPAELTATIENDQNAFTGDSPGTARLRSEEHTA